MGVWNAGWNEVISTSSFSENGGALHLRETVREMSWLIYSPKNITDFVPKWIGQGHNGKCKLAAMSDLDGSSLCED